MAEYKNMIGTEFPNYVTKQLEARKDLVKKNNRTNRDLLWLTNRTGWYKISSGALIGGKNDLARKNILQGGTVEDAGGGEISLKSGFRESYTSPGGELGFRPTPNVNSLSIGTGGRWQSLLQAEVEIQAYDLAQLETISKLYMSLGVHIFIEWGHIPYVTNEKKVEISSIRPIDFFNVKFDGADNLEKKLLPEISKKKKTYEGNYEAFIGRVYNFDYTANSDGSYTCKIKIMGPGAMADSLKAISSYSGKDADVTPDEDTTKYGSDLENALVSIKNALNSVAVAKVKEKNVGVLDQDIPLGEVVEIGGTQMFKAPPVSWLKNFLAGKSLFFRNPSYGSVLNETYGSCNLSDLSFSGDGVPQYSPSTSLSKFGNASQLIHKIDGDKGYGLSELPPRFYHGYATTLTYEEAFFESNKVRATYISLGHLFCLVQHLGVFVIKSGEPQPAIRLDYHPDNTPVKTGIIQASIDPSICIVPLAQTKSLGTFLAPLKVNKDTPYDFQQNKDRANNTKNFSLFKDLDELTGNIPNFDDGEGGGKLFNILINVDFAINTLKSLKRSTSDRVATLKNYLDSILDGVNRALGGINNFKVNFVDCSQTLRVVDENYIPPNPTYLTIPPFGKESVAYDYSYSSKISKELASQIVIATSAQSTGEKKVLEDMPEDVFSYFYFNEGVTDRFTGEIVPPKDPPPSEPQEIQNLRAFQSLYDQLYNIFSLSSEDPIGLGVSEDLFNFYNSLQQKFINKSNSKRKQGVLMPIELSITLDGISGILPYNAFLLPNNRLPSRYKDNIAFIVFSINHIFQNNQWLTQLRGQTIIKP